jgi:carboxyl-terminal processing protease
MRKLLLILVALFLFSAVAAAPAAPPRTGSPGLSSKWAAPKGTAGLTKQQRQKNLESFDLAWKTVRDSHYDPKLGGVNWQKVRDELRPKVEKAESMDEARGIMRDMLGRLGHSHVGLIPAGDYEEMEAASARGKAGTASQLAEPGFDVRMVGGEAVVVRVSPGLPAARAGVRPGWRVRRINGAELAPTLDRIARAVAKTHRAPVVQAVVIRWRLRGEEGKEVAVTFLDESGREKALSIPRARPLGHMVRQVGIPPTYVHFEARKLEGGITYFYLSDFLDPLRVMPAFEDTVRKDRNAEGFILDLRGNGGGLVAMGLGLGGWFVDQPDLKVGTGIQRTGSTPVTLNPREVTYEGPLAILVDELSGSTSEVLAAGLQDLKRARVFGTRTAGACLPSTIVRLPNDDRLQYVVADYVSAGGKRLEGNGVQPDEVVPTDRQALRDGRDATLEAAVRWIRTQRGARQARK